MNDVHIEQSQQVESQPQQIESQPQQIESQVEHVHTQPQQVESQPQQQINELKRPREDDTNVPAMTENQHSDNDMRQPDEKKIKLDTEATDSESAPTTTPATAAPPASTVPVSTTAPASAPTTTPATATAPAPATPATASPVQDLNSSIKVESSDKKSKGRLALLERLKGAVRKTEDILESAASPVPVATTPPTKKSSRSRKSKGIEDQEEFEPESRQQTPASASRERRSRRPRKSTNYGANDPYEMADTITKLLVGPFRTCYEILQQIKKHPWAWPFAEPVDVEGLGIPDYLIIIKNPMDLGTVQQKLTTGQYPTVYDFANDMRLIWHNCKLYNQPGSDVAKMASELQVIFEDRFKKVVDEVESPNNASAKMREMQAQMREMQAKIDDLSSIPPNGQYQLENLPPGMIATPAQSAQPASSRARGGRGGRKSVGSARGSRKSTQQQPVVDSRPMTFEEKKELSELIGQLNNDQLASVVEIIQLHAPRDDYANQTETEIEIDLDQLNPVTLRELERFSKESLGLIKTRRKPGPKPGSKRKPAAKRSSIAGRGGKENSDITHGADSTTTLTQQQESQSQSLQQPHHQHQQQPHQQSHDTDEETDDDSDTSTDSSGDELDSDSDDDKKNRPQSLSSTQAIA